MSRKALKVAVEVTFRAVSCPGVHLPAKHDVYLSMCCMGQYRQSEDLPAVFPLLFYEKMRFEKIFRHAVDPGDITMMLEYETVRIELVQLILPMGDTLACFEEDARRFLFPKLVPSFSGVDREVLMTRASHFPGIAPRLEFSTKTTIVECSADEEINIYPNVTMRPVVKRHRKCSGRSRTSSPQKRQPQTLGRKQVVRKQSERKGNSRSLPPTPRSLPPTPRSQSLSPLRAGNTQLSLDAAAPGLSDWDSLNTSQPMLASWPGTSPSALRHHSVLFTSSPLVKSSSSVRFSASDTRKPSVNGLVNRTNARQTLAVPPRLLASQTGGISEGESRSSETTEPLNCCRRPDPSALWLTHRKQATHSSSHREWEEVHERVRGLLTTPKAVRRLVYGATVSEVDRALAKSSVSP